MLLLGLTGNIAAGKSAVATILVERGCTVIDADVLAREAVAPGSVALAAIVARWGQRILQQDGSLDRAALRRLVFARDTERNALNAIVHPEIERLRARDVAAARERGAGIVVCDIPLLYENDLADNFDAVILVDAPESLRLERLMRARGLSREDAESMMRAQMPTSAKRSRADVVIDNTGSLDDLRLATAQAMDTLEARLTSDDHASSRRPGRAQP